MKMTKIRQKAKGLGVNPGRMSKTNLIRAIQQAEGNPTCFGSAHDFCDRYDCCWREDCLTKEV